MNPPDTLSVQVIVSALCLFLGGALSNTPITRWLIPFAVAIGGGLIYSAYTGDYSARGFILGIYAGIASTGFYEATKKRSGRQKPDGGYTGGRNEAVDRLDAAIANLPQDSVFPPATRNAGGTPAAPSSAEPAPAVEPKTKLL